MAKNPQLTRQQQVELTKEKLMTQLGKTGVVLLKGVISQEEYNRDLVGKKGLEVYDRMRRSDGTVKAALMSLKLPIRAAQWRVDPVSDDPKDMLAQQLVEQSLFRNISWDDFLREALTMLDFGFSVFEQTFEVSPVDGKDYVLLKDMGFRKQTSITKWEAFIDGLAQPGVTQQLQSSETIAIPAVKLTHFAYDQEGDNFEGISVLRAAYKHWYMKDTLYQVDAIKHEKQGLGILKIQTPSTAKEEDKTTAREIAREQRANEEAYIEELEGFNFEFMDMKSRTTTDIIPSVNHHDRRILISVLAQFLDIGSDGSSGSYSAGSTQADLFLMSLEATAKEVAERINQSVVKNICELNGLILEEYPRVTYDRIGQDSIDIFSGALQKLFASGGITPDPELENYLRKFLHLPEMTDDMADNYDEVRAMRRNPAMPTAPTDPSSGDSTPTSASEMIRQGRAFREKLRSTADGEDNS